MLGLLMGLGLTSALAAPPAGGDQELLRDLITVEGQAEVLVPPDKVAITLTIERRAQSQVQAETAAKTAADEVLAIAREHGVKEADIDASDYVLQPLYEWSGGKRLAKRLGFLVRRTLVVTLRELPRFGSLLSRIVETDAVAVTSVDPAIEDTRAHRDKARLMAIRAAREKAQAIVAELGQSLGRAVTIEVDGASSVRCCGAGGEAGRNYLASPNARTNSNSLTIERIEGAGYALGAITLKAQVKVWFELR